MLARRDLGMVYMQTALPAKARVCFEKVIAVAPDDYLSHFELGVAYGLLGQKKEAIEHLQIACSIAPASEQCHIELDKLKEPAR
jgi:Tfp pilus assembly protein PilF